MFHPAAVRRLSLLTAIPGVSALVLAAHPLLRRLPGGRYARRAALAGLAFSLIMLAERELRGEDVPGASDNASGAAVAAQLAVECAARPLAHTQVDLLVTSMRGVRAARGAGLCPWTERARRRDAVPQLRHGGR